MCATPPLSSLSFLAPFDALPSLFDVAAAVRWLRGAFPVELAVLCAAVLFVFWTVAAVAWIGGAISRR